MIGAPPMNGDVEQVAQAGPIDRTELYTDSDEVPCELVDDHGTL
jgi:hypothetical protein